MTIEQALQLANSPDRVLLALLVMGIIVGAIFEWWVPGRAYRREVKRNDTLTESMTALTKTVEGVADDIAWNASPRRPRTRRDG